MGKRFGVMLDMSRNAVMTVENVKKYIDYIYSFGYNCLMLYMEDTFEVKNEPFFGAGRGRYSQNELKELNKYCDNKGVELIPCIQTLAHLNAIFKWSEYSEINDIDDILLAENDRTYKLIDNIFSTISECFSSKTVHIGMDEAYHLGLGKYLEKNGYSTRFEIMKKHLGKVVEIAEKYELNCIMWSDMFYRLATGGEYYDYKNFDAEKVRPVVNKNVDLVYWDYYHKDEEFYSEMIKSHKTITDRPIWFAGGAWSWTGFAPRNAYSIKTMIPAMRACKKNGIDNIFITLWGDNGGECSKFSLLPSLFMIKCAYDGEFDDNTIKSRFYELTGENYDDMLMLDLPDRLFKDENFESNPSKYMFYSDLFNGFFKSFLSEYGEEKLAKSIKLLSVVNSQNFAYLFESSIKLCEVLKEKYFLGKEIRVAYSGDDRVALLICVDKINILIKKVEGFYSSFKKQWFIENKPHGFDVQDIRIGGLLMRLKSCRERIEQYLSGKINAIEELNEDLSFIKEQDDSENSTCFFNVWDACVTVNVL